MSKDATIPLEFAQREKWKKGMVRIQMDGHLDYMGQTRIAHLLDVCIITSIKSSSVNGKLKIRLGCFITLRRKPFPIIEMARI